MADWRQGHRDDIRDWWQDNAGDFDDWFDDSWWNDNHIDWPYYPGFGYWGWAAWNGLTDWVDYGWSEPVYYNYGENVYYEDGSVYYGDQPVCTEVEYAEQAEAIAMSAPGNATGSRRLDASGRVCRDIGWPAHRCRAKHVYAARSEQARCDQRHIPEHDDE